MSSRRLLAAAFEYDAFGQTQRATGPLARDFVFRFSTKWTDAETGELDYGRRRYSPSLGRFTSRDPIEEKGGMNLYAFVQNNPVTRWDYLGMVEQLRWLRASTKDIVNQRWMWEDGDGFETDVVGQGVNLYAGLNPGLSQGSKTPGWMANNATPGAGAVADAQAHRIRRTLQGATVVGVYTTDGQADAVRARKGDGTEYNIPLDPQSSTAGLLTEWVQSLSAPNSLAQGSRVDPFDSTPLSASPNRYGEYVGSDGNYYRLEGGGMQDATGDFLIGAAVQQLVVRPLLGLAGRALSSVFGQGAGESATQAVTISTHGMRHFPTSVQPAVSTAIRQDLATLGTVAPGQIVQRTITVGGQQVTYRVFGLPNGTVNVGTTFPGIATRNIAVPPGGGGG